jgi:hypothetical protein
MVLSVVGGTAFVSAINAFPGQAISGLLWQGNPGKLLDAAQAGALTLYASAPPRVSGASIRVPPESSVHGKWRFANARPEPDFR